MNNVKTNCFAWDAKRKQCNALGKTYCKNCECDFYKSKEQYETDLDNGFVKCKNCTFAKIDKHASERKWTAYQCTNVDSDYYGCLLNVRPDGDKELDITWYGCENGEG